MHGRIVTLLCLSLLLFPFVTAEVVWESDWSTATGTSQTATTDGGAWTGELCGNFRAEHGAVVSATGLDFPTENVFRSLYSDVSTCYMATVENQWTMPDVGEYQFIRYYYRLEAPQGFNPGNTHFFHHGVQGSAPYETWWWLDAGDTVDAQGRYTLTFVFNVNQATGQEWAQIELNTYETYRIEHRMHRVSAGEVHNDVLIYDSSNTLVFDSADFVMSGGSGSAFSTHPVYVNDPVSHFQTLQVGWNGAGVQPNIGTRYGYIGAVAVGVSANPDDWIGPHGATTPPDGPNEPAGFERLSTNPWDVLSGSGWGHVNRASESRIISDTQWNGAVGNVLEHIYPTGYVGGSEPGVNYYVMNEPEVYVNYKFKFSPDWQAHPTGVNKVTFLWFGSDFSGGNIIMNLEQTGNPNEYHMIINPETSALPDGRMYSNTGNDVLMYPDQWYDIELYVRMESSPSANDGVYRWWVNGVLVGDYTGQDSPSANPAQFEFAPTWGGLGSTKTQDDWFRFDNTKISVPGTQPPTDTTPPTATITAPSNSQTLSSGTTSTTLSASTNEAATCRYGTSDVAYGSLPNILSGAGSTSHSATLSGLTDGSTYTYYVRCQDAAGNTMSSSESVSFSVTSSTTSLLWESDWSTATGNSQNALQDGGLWNVQMCSDADLVEVISASTLEFPSEMENVFRVEYDPEKGNCYMVAVQDAWPAPEVGEYIFYRIYYRANIANGINLNQAHPFQAYGTSTYFWFVNTAGLVQDGTTQWHIQRPFVDQTSDYPAMLNNRFLTTLSTYETYRIEMRFHRYVENAAKLSVRVYDSSGQLVADDNTFCDLECRNTLAEINPDFTLTDGAGAFRRIELGNNDAGVIGPGQYQHWGGFAVRVSENATDWIGPYAGEGVVFPPPNPSVLLGDRNDDGVVNLLDILIIINDFRKITFDARADVNGDGVVNVFDLVLVARDFGRIQQNQSPPPQEATIFLQESFDDTNFASRGWYDDVDQTITSAEAISGSALELHYDTGDTIPNNGNALRHLFDASESVYVSYWVKYSDNWQGSNRPYHPHEMQIVTNVDSMWLGPAYSHLTAYIEHNEGVPMLAIQDAQNIDDTQIGTNLVGVTENRAVAGCNGNGDGYDDDCYYTGTQWRNGKGFRANQIYFSDVQGPYYKGDWHFIEAYFQLNTIENGIGQPDGVVQYWYDGELIIDNQDVYLRTAEHPDMQFNQFLLAHYIGDGSPVDQTVWIDNLTIANQRPQDMVNDGAVQQPLAFNEPAGFSIINDVHWTSISSPWIAYSSNPEGATTIEDGTILQWLYPQGGTGGATFGDRIIAEGAPTHGPVQYHREEGIMVSANFQGHGSGVNKLRFWLAPDDTTDGYLMFQGSGSNPLYPAINTQGWPEFGTTPLLVWNGVSNLANPAAQEAEFTRGELHTVETLVDKGTPGNADGSVRLWLNGVLILHFEGLSLTPGSEAASFGGLHYSPVWGGIDGMVSQDMTLRIDRTYVSTGSI